MQNYIYADLANGCLQVSEKLWRAATKRRGSSWTLELSGHTAGIIERYGDWTLTLPALPLDARMTAREKDLWTGYVIHETGHACFSDFTVWRRALGEGLGDLVNGLEDPRIEARLIKADLAANAKDLLQGLADHFATKALADGWDPADPKALAFTLAIYGRIHVGGFKLPSVPALDAATAAALAWIWPRLKACKTTQDCLDLAREIAQAKPLGQGQGKGGSGKAPDGAQTGSGRAGRPGQGEGSAPAPGGAGQGSQPSQEEGEKGGDASQGSGEGQKGEGEGQGEASQGGTAEQSGEASSGGAGVSRSSGFGSQKVEFDLNDLARKIMERSGKRQTPGEAAADREIVKLGRMVPQPSEARSYGGSAKDLERVFPSVSKLKADLSRIVKSPEFVGADYGFRSGRLDRRAFAKAMTGCETVFARRDYQEGVNAAVSIVLDASSSMREHGKIKFAHAMALAICDALDRAAVPFELSKTGAGFGTFNVEIVKGFSTQWRKRRDILGSLHVLPGTCNLVGTQSAVDRLLQVRDATRRIVFVLSDGEDRHDDDTWRRAAQIWAAKGVEVVGVGLLHDVSGAFEHSVTVRDPETLAREGLGTLLKRLKAPARAA